MLTQTEQLGDSRRRFTLTQDDIALVNPNARTCPIFRSGHDAELTKAVYHRVPVLIDERQGAAGNPWGITFLRMFDMANDSGVFVTTQKILEGRKLPNELGKALTDHIFALAEERNLLPLYEAKMIHHFDHRYGDFANAKERDEADYREIPHASDEVMADPRYRPTPRYWVEAREVHARLADKGWTRGWLMGWRDITNATNERTVIASAIPRGGRREQASAAPCQQGKLAIHERQVGLGAGNGLR